MGATMKTMIAQWEELEELRINIKAPNEKLDKLLLARQKQIHHITDEEHFQMQEGGTDQTEELCYIQRVQQGLQQLQAQPKPLLQKH